MTDDVIYCPNCKRHTKFMSVPKYVRDFEGSSNDTIRVNVIQCGICDYPIGVYPDPAFPAKEEK